MKTIYLTGKRANGRCVLVDDDDYEKLNNRKWFFQPITHRKSSVLKSKGLGYAKSGFTIEKRVYKVLFMHRIIVNAPKGMCVDHIDGNPLNNQRSNLRICTNAQNLMNRSKDRDSKSGYKGVTIRTKGNDRGIVAQIGINGKQIRLGKFSNVIDAAKAYNEAAIKYHGQFANINKI